MRKLKKILSAALLVSALTMSSLTLVGAKTSAGEAEKGDLKIEVPEAATVKAYQVIVDNDGDWALTDWAKTALGDDADDALAALTNSENGNSSTITKYLRTLANSSSKVQAGDTATTTAKGTAIVDTNGSAASSDDQLGSYLVIVESDNYAYSNMLVSTYDSAATGTSKLKIGEGTAKGTYTGDDEDEGKKVVESKTPDTGNEEVAVGDIVTFTIKGTTPDFRGSDSPQLIISDTLGTGLTLVTNDSTRDKYTEVTTSSTDATKIVTVKVNGTELTGVANKDLSAKTEAFKVTKETNGFKVTFNTEYIEDDLEAFSAKAYEITYMVRVSALNTDNKYTNTVTPSYTIENFTDPEDPDDPPTPVDGPPYVSTIYTAGLKLNKYYLDGTTEKSLSGAGFTLKVSDGDKTLKDKYINIDSNGIVTYVAEANATEFTTGSDGTITIQGIDPDLTYTLSEKTAPEGYSKVSDDTIKFTADSTDPSKYTVTTGTSNTDVSEDSSEAASVTPTVKIKDVALGALPETGSVGMVVATIAGVILMIVFGTGYIALSKKKANR